MSKEKTVESAINALAKATKALDKMYNVVGGGLMSVEIEPWWAGQFFPERCGASFHILRDKVDYLAKIYGAETDIKEFDDGYEFDGEQKSVHYYGFVHDGIWIYSSDHRTVKKGEN